MSEPPDGFKQTEIGLIPEEWEIAELGNVCQHRRELVEPQRNGATRYVGLEHIDSGNPKLQRYGSASEVRSSKSRFRAGDVLYGKLRPYLDKAVLAEWGGICSTDILVFKAIEEQTTPEFLVHLLHSPDFLAHAINTTSGVNHPRTSWSDIKTFKFPLPPLPDQRAIAHVLSKIQAAAQAQAAIAGRARELKRALMAKLFTEGLRGDNVTEWIEHPLYGSVPRHWFAGTLGDLCKDGHGVIQTGPFGSQLHASDYKETGIPVVNPTHLADNRVIHEAIPLISKEDHRRLSRHILRRGDILFARRGEIGRHALITAEENDWLCGTGCFLVRVKNPSVDNAFLSWFLCTEPCQLWLKAHAVGSIMPNLNTKVLQAVPVVLPPIDEQREIASILQTVDAKIAAAERKRAGLEELFRAMLGELMAGRVRVKTLP